jgi:hypothetical protein
VVEAGKTWDRFVGNIGLPLFKVDSQLKCENGTCGILSFILN